MTRKRKVAVNNDKVKQQLNVDRKQILKVLFKVQTNEHYHSKYAKELRQLYERMKDEEFTGIFINCLKQLMQSNCNQFASTGLKFMAEFVTSFQAEDMHPLFDSIFQWIFKTVSLTASVRLRLCEFVNQILNSLPDDGDIEEYHCNEILAYMFERLKDISPHVRVQAIKALCRLQIKDDPNDEVTQIFLSHLEFDPSPLVRQSVISSIARSTHTIPYILEHLSDVDVRVRRSVVAHMSNYSLTRCTVEQRLTLIERGLNDSSEMVRNIALQILLPQWLTLCDKNFISFLSNLRPSDGNESEMQKFRNVARSSLLAVFGSHEPASLIKVLPLIGTDDDETYFNYQRCIQLDKLTPELSVFWVALIEHLQRDASKCEHLEQILPDLPTMCNYIATFSRQISRCLQHDDRHSSQFILLALVDVLLQLDLSEETGRDSVESLVTYLLMQRFCDESLTKSLIKICEKLITTANRRLQFYVGIVNHILYPIDVGTIVLSGDIDAKVDDQVAALMEKLSELKGEQTKRLEMNERQHDKLGAIEEEIALLQERLLYLVVPFLRRETLITDSKRITSDHLLRALKFIFYGVCSQTVKHLTPSIYQLYEDIIRVRIESDNLEIRNWALKCTATFSLLYGKLASEAYYAFCKHLFCHQVKSIWITSIKAIFQLINRYGCEFLSKNQNENRPPTANNPLLNVTPMECEPTDDNHDVPCTDHEYVPPYSILRLFNEYLDSSLDADITCELVDGFCLLIVHGRYIDCKIIMCKLIVMFVDANVEPKIVQILSVFFETLIRLKKQKTLLSSVYETLTAVTAAKESFTENKLRSVLKFFTESMVTNGSNAVGKCDHHNDLAVTLLTWMSQHSTETKALAVASKEMLSLKLSVDEDEEFKLKLIELVDDLLTKKLHRETEKNVKLFEQTITQPNGTEILEFSSIRPADGVEEDGISIPNGDSETEMEVNGNEDDSKQNI